MIENLIKNIIVGTVGTFLTENTTRCERDTIKETASNIINPSSSNIYNPSDSNIRNPR